MTENEIIMQSVVIWRDLLDSQRTEERWKDLVTATRWLIEQSKEGT